MVEHGRLGGSRGRAVVVTRNRVQQLCENCGIEVAPALLDHPQAEVDVAEQAPFVSRPERRPWPELADPADVVQERSGEHDVVTQPRMELRRLSAERGHAHRMLEEATCIAVMTVGGGGRQRAERLPDVGVANERVDDCGEARVRDLGGEELEESVELVCIPAQRGRQRGRIRVLRSLDRAHLDLKPAAEALDATEHANGVALVEALVEEVDVVPDARLDATAGSTSSRARYEAPARVRRRSFLATANTPSTVLSSTSSAIVVTSRLYGASPLVRSPRWATSSRFAPSATPARPARWPISSRRRTTLSTTRSARRSTRGVRTTSST